MSNIAQAFLLVTIGGIAGIGGFALLARGPAPANATTAPASTDVVITAAEPVEQEPLPVPAQDGVSVTYSTTGSVEADAADAAYAVLRVNAHVDVADVVLHVAGKSGARAEEALGADSAERQGPTLKIELGDMHAEDEREVVVAFRLRNDRGGFTTTTSYRDLHTGREANVVGSEEGNSLTRSMREAAVYETVRLAYSEQAVAVARDLRDDGDYTEAMNWVEHTYATNVEVGMTLRLTGELNGVQGELSRMRDELKVLMQPKKKPVRRPKPEIKIEIVRGDT